MGIWALTHEITSPMNISFCACLIRVEGGFVADGDVAAVGVGGVGQRVAVLPRGGGGGGRTAGQAHHVTVAGEGTKRGCDRWSHPRAVKRVQESCLNDIRKGNGVMELADFADNNNWLREMRTLG